MYTPVLAIAGALQPYRMAHLWTPDSQELHHILGALRREGTISHGTRIARVPSAVGSRVGSGLKLGIPPIGYKCLSIPPK